MKPALSTKHERRNENKRKKMEALLTLAASNKKSLEYKKQINNVEEEIQPPLTQNIVEKSNRLEENPNVEIGKSGKRKLEGEEYLELKKRLKAYYDTMRHKPKFRLRTAGENASLELDADDRTPLFMSDIQHLLLYSQIGIHAPYSPARWCCLEKYNRLLNTNVLVVEDLSLNDFINHKSYFQFLDSNFTTKLEILTPTCYNGDIVKELCLVPITGTQMKKFLLKHGSLEMAASETNDLFDVRRKLFPIKENESITSKDLPPGDQFSRTQILLSGWQLIEENYPLPIKGLMERKYAGYVLTKDKYEKVTPHSPMFGIDCEMCITSIGDNELTRVSVVDEKLNVVYDTLVKPPNKITDYLTRYSGITPKMMKNVTKTLKNVQDELRAILPADAILVGQSLSNDMHALKMMHPYIIDTSIIFNITGDRLRKTKLQTLAREFLSEKIQMGNQGHCSTEDCSASLKLAQLKLSKSLDFGDAVMGSKSNEYQGLPQLGSQNYATSMFKHITRQEDKKSIVIGSVPVSEKYKHCIDKGVITENDKICIKKTNSDNDVLNELCNSFVNYSFNLAHIKFVDNGLREEHCQKIKELDKNIENLYNKTLAPGLVVIIFSGTKTTGNGCCFICLKC